jgi:hypothetical protein
MKGFVGFLQEFLEESRKMITEGSDTMDYGMYGFRDTGSD